MFLIMGSPRSGNTLMSATLEQLGPVLMIAETDEIVPLAHLVAHMPESDTARSAIASFVCASRSYPLTLGRHLDPGRVAEIVRAAPYSLPGIVSALYDGAAEAAGRALVGNKSPNDIAAVRILDAGKLFDGGMKVIHLVRDVRDVLVSLSRVGWAPRGIETHTVRTWNAANTYLNERLGGETHRYMLIRYEDLVASPEPTFEAVCKLLGIEFDPERLDPKRRTHYVGFEGHKRVGEEITPQTVGLWKTDLDPALAAEAGVLAAEGLERFGYELPSQRSRRRAQRALR